VRDPDSFTPRMCESCIRKLHAFTGLASGALSPPTSGNRNLVRNPDNAKNLKHNLTHG
jgi:hypothetical protein